MPGFGGLRRGWNMPCGAKRPEVVEPNQVHVGQQRFQPINAPAITRAVKSFPIIHRVAPELSFGTEIVWRHAGHKPGPEIGIKLEPLGIGPNIAGIERHEERQIPDEERAAVVGIFLQAVPLAGH